MKHVYLAIESKKSNTEGCERIVEIGAAEVLDGRLTGRTFHACLPADPAVCPADVAGRRESRCPLLDKSWFQSIAPALENLLAAACVFIHDAYANLPTLEAELARAGSEPLLSQVDSVHDTSSLLSSIFPDQCCDIPWLAARLGIREEVSDLDALGRATLLARLCGRVHRISALAFPQSAEKEWVGFLNLARELDAMLELPPEFGIAYLQRHLTIGYNSATRSMNQLCRMGIVEWSLDGRGKMIFERPSVVGDSGFFCS